MYDKHDNQTRVPFLAWTGHSRISRGLVNHKQKCGYSDKEISCNTATPAATKKHQHGNSKVSYRSDAEWLSHCSLLKMSELTNDSMFNEVPEGTNNLEESSSKSENNDFVQKKKRW